MECVEVEQWVALRVNHLLRGGGKLRWRRALAVRNKGLCILLLLGYILGHLGKGASPAKSVHSCNFFMHIVSYYPPS